MNQYPARARRGEIACRIEPNPMQPNPGGITMWTDDAAPKPNGTRRGRRVSVVGVAVHDADGTCRVTVIPIDVNSEASDRQITASCVKVWTRFESQTGREPYGCIVVDTDEIASSANSFEEFCDLRDKWASKTIGAWGDIQHMPVMVTIHV